jgi:hypothetical protein
LLVRLLDVGELDGAVRDAVRVHARPFVVARRRRPVARSTYPATESAAAQ